MILKPDVKESHGVCAELSGRPPRGACRQRAPRGADAGQRLRRRSSGAGQRYFSEKTPSMGVQVTFESIQYFSKALKHRSTSGEHR